MKTAKKNVYTYIRLCNFYLEWGLRFVGLLFILFKRRFLVLFFFFIDTF